MSDNDNSKVYAPSIESVEEFIQRFKLQNNDKLTAASANPTKCAMLLANCLPITILTDIQRRLKPKLLTNATYEELEANLLGSYGVKKSIIGAAVAFLNRKQKPQESIENYSKVLNELASQCKYLDCCRDRMLRDVFLSGLRSSRLISALITEGEERKFSECVEKAKLLEQVTQDVQDMNPAEKVHPQNKVFPSRNEHSKNKSFTKGAGAARKSIPTNYKCIRCGAANKHLAEDCFAINVTCHTCNKKGHISKACRNAKHGKAKTYRSHVVQPYDNPEEFDATDFIQMHHVRKISQRIYNVRELDTFDDDIALGSGMGVATSNSFDSLPDEMEIISDQCYENGKIGSYSDVVKGRSLCKPINHLKNDRGKIKAKKHAFLGQRSRSVE